MYVPKDMQKTCMYQIMHTRKHLNILKHFIQNIIYKNNMYQCVPQDDGAFIFLLGRRLYISLRAAPKINSLLTNRVRWSLRRS